MADEVPDEPNKLRSVHTTTLPQLMHQAEFEDVVGRENICEHVQAALRRAEDVFEGVKTAVVGG